MDKLWKHDPYLSNLYLLKQIITCLKDLAFFLCADAINLEVPGLHFNNNILMWLK
jgi:hypothetical protein